MDTVTNEVAFMYVYNNATRYVKRPLIIVDAIIEGSGAIGETTAYRDGRSNYYLKCITEIGNFVIMHKRRQFKLFYNNDLIGVLTQIKKNGDIPEGSLVKLVGNKEIPSLQERLVARRQCEKGSFFW